ncbi:MAG: M14 family metallocarboxypeptidase, partial [Rhizobacter sp.]
PLGPLPPPQRQGSAAAPPPATPPRGAAAQPVPVPSATLPPSTPLPTSPSADATPATEAPYGPAVAARFPDPPVTFKTPAFAPGHAGFTSNPELHAALAELVRSSNQRLEGADVKLLALGTSQNGTPLEALLLSRKDGGSGLASLTRPASGVGSGRPTVLLVGQQHGDEPAPAEALLVVAQELAGGRLEPVLEHVDVIVMPRANPDGAEAGRRTTANGIDVNRDHLLLQTPEAQAQAILMRNFAPIVAVDAHEYTVVGRFLEKFGAVQRYDALIQYATTANVPEFVTKAAEEWFREPVFARLKEAGFSTEWYYTTSNDINDKKISMGGTQPDTGRNVNGLTNAVSVLIETRGVGLGRVHLARRVQTHVVALESLLQSAAARAADMVKVRQYVDQEVSALACHGEVVVEAAPTPSEHRLLMIDPETGADKPVVVAWDSALQLRNLKARPRPCGYWLAEQEGDAVQRLRALGVQVLRIDQAAEVRGEYYRETAREVAARDDVRGPLAEAGVLRLKVQLVPALLDLKPGGFYVPLDQPLGNLVVAALEPDTQNSYMANHVIGSLDAQARVLVPPTLSTTPVE